jgi:pectate lyase-like protein
MQETPDADTMNIPTNPSSAAVLAVLITCLAITPTQAAEPAGQPDRSEQNGYEAYIRTCLDTLIKHGTDRYGKVHTPMLVSILDTETLRCPREPDVLDEAYRVTRRDRRNPAASDLDTDQALLKTMVLYSALSTDRQYAEFAERYASYALENLIDDHGLIWWGWHRRYDVFEDVNKGHSGDHHEIHAIHEIQWDLLWEANPEATNRTIEAIWQWHVIDKQTGEINRHADGQPGCDFSMSAGAFIEAFAFMYQKTDEKKWLDRARLLAKYYWDRRNPDTDLFPERPNAGEHRFDGSSSVTAITGLYCHSLLKAWQLTQDEVFRDHAVAYLKAYGKYGHDDQAGKFWGALRLDGTPILGPPVKDGYAAYEPRGHLTLWEPYVAGYQHAIYTAQAYASAYQMTGDKKLLETAERFARWIAETPPGTCETHENAWYHAYSTGPGKEGTYAGKYGRAVSFLLTMYVATDDDAYLKEAQNLADEAVEKLWDNGLFRGHPAKPYYESLDGVGYLLYAQLQLECVLEHPQSVLAKQAITIKDGNEIIPVPLENW